MRLALESTIIPEIRRNIHDQFDTSGDFPSRVDVEIINQYRADLVVRAVYAAVHEYGGTFEITPRQRGFFWYMFSTTQDSMWKALALSDTYTIPARPYFRPAILSEQRDAYEVMGEELYDIIAKAVN
jgi:phage gpG-like protein